VPSIGRINIFIFKKKKVRPQSQTILATKRPVFLEYRKIKLGILILVE